MAKRIKFALEMKDSVQVRNLDDLRKHFDLDKTIGYFVDGKLLKWLEDRYYDEEAEAISALSKDDSDFNSKICKILGVEYEDEDLPEIDPEEIERRNERIAKLKQYTADTKILDKVDLVAFDQEELADLLDEEEPVIYLCQNKFTIPLREKNKKYIGIGKAEAVIRSKTVVDFAERNIEFVNVSFNAEYEKLLKEEQGSLPTEKSEETLDNTSITLLQEAQKAEADKDFDVALALYKRIGSAEALYHMGKIYNNTAYIKYDKQKAIDYFKQAAEKGNEDAKNLISLISETPQNNIVQSDDNYDYDKDDDDTDYDEDDDGCGEDTDDYNETKIKKNYIDYDDLNLYSERDIDYFNGIQVAYVAMLGHIDHGKTTLSSAITKVLSSRGLAEYIRYNEIDNAPEEQFCTVSMNISRIEYETDHRHYIQFDCPKNCDCIKNMYMNIPKIKNAILVVSAADGPMPQTREQIWIARLLGIENIVVFLNKADQVDDPELLELTEMEVRVLLSSYDYPGDELPVITGSAFQALEGDKYAENKILELLYAMDDYFLPNIRQDRKPFLMPIEDVFYITGRGTVGTGCVERGTINLGETVEIVGLTDYKKQSVIVGIEMLRKMIDSAIAGDNIGIKLRSKK